MKQMNIFYQEKERNFFDNLVVDVKQVYERFPIGKKINPKPNAINFINSPFHKIYRNPFLPIKHRNYFWYLFRRLNLDLTWFDEFKAYWSTILNGRPLWGVYDLWFLKNLYRIKFQNNQVSDTDDTKIHLEAWQRPELIYQLLHLACKESTSNELKKLNLLNKYRNGNINMLLEFGCATAPITTSLFEFFRPSQNLRIYISDIQTLSFHYASYKFINCSNVIPLLLTPDNDFSLNLGQKVDAIFCITVFEHLNKPLETINTFHKILDRGGLLFFDYIKSEGDGLDTYQGVRERDAVLDFISKNFEIVYGKIKKEENVTLAIARKR